MHFPRFSAKIRPSVQFRWISKVGAYLEASDNLVFLGIAIGIAGRVVDNPEEAVHDLSEALACTMRDADAVSALPAQSAHTRDSPLLYRRGVCEHATEEDQYSCALS
jgi:hypothetical protein